MGFFQAEAAFPQPSKQLIPFPVDPSEQAFILRRNILLSKSPFIGRLYGFPWDLIGTARPDNPLDLSAAA